MAAEIDIFLASIRDAYVQVSAFVAITVLLFGYLQYRTGGRLSEELRERTRLQPLVGALMGLTPGCGGAIVMMPLYVRGTVSFGTVVATLIATAGDSAFVILVLAPEAAFVAYSLAFVAAIASGYAIDRWGLGVARVDRAVASISPAATDGGVVTERGVPTRAFSEESNFEHGHDHGRDDESTVVDRAIDRLDPVLSPLTTGALVAWWIAALLGLGLGVAYLLRGAPEVAMALGASFDGLFTVVGISGTVLSVYLYVVGRRVLGGHRHMGAVAHSRWETLVDAATETSFVTVWVVAAYLVYEYGILYTGVEIQTAAAAAGLLAPVGGAVIGLIPGCGPQIVLATVYANGGIPFSALVANAISQDGDALFPLLAIDRTAAVVATIYTTIPGLLVGIALHAVFGPMWSFGVL